MEYCKCEKVKEVYPLQEEWGVWLVCSKCNKPLEFSYKQYNHFDGEDHIDTEC